MKKTILTIAIVLGMAVGASAQNTGLLGYGPQRGAEDYDYSSRENPMIHLPNSHTNTDSDAPLGTGIAMLIGFGAAYAMKKRSNK